jgi:hypothetical protein
VKVEELIVAALIAWLKVAVTVVLTATLLAPLAGVTVVTVGAGAATVVNDQLKFAARAVPAEAVAPVVMVAVYCVP